MKKITTLLLILSMLLTAVSLSSCDVFDTDALKSDGQTEEDTTTAPQIEPIEDEKPIIVKDVNGMNAEQLYDKLVRTLTDMKTYELNASMTEIVDGQNETLSIVQRIGADSAYEKRIYSDTTGSEIHIIDNLAYFRSNDVHGNKTSSRKYSLESFEQAMEYASVELDFSDSPYVKLPTREMKDAVIYLKNGEYYFCVDFTASDSIEDYLGYGESGTVTLYFDADGLFTKCEIVTEKSYSETLTFKNIGKEIVVEPPANADDYPLAMPYRPDVDAKGYAVYEEACKSFNGEYISFEMSYEYGEGAERQEIIYSKDIQGDIMLDVYEGGTVDAIFWHIGDKYYVSADGSAPVDATEMPDVENVFAEMLAGVESLRSLFSNIISPNDIRTLTYTHDEAEDIYTVVLKCVDETDSGSYTVFEYVVDYSYSELRDWDHVTSVKITATDYTNGAVTAEMTCSFEKIGNIFYIEPPIA